MWSYVMHVLHYIFEVHERAHVYRVCINIVMALNIRIKKYNAYKYTYIVIIMVMPLIAHDSCLDSMQDCSCEAIEHVEQKEYKYIFSHFLSCFSCVENYLFLHFQPATIYSCLMIMLSFILRFNFTLTC